MTGRKPVANRTQPASTIPVAWTVRAICAAAVSTSALEVTARYRPPLRAAALEATTLTWLYVL